MRVPPPAENGGFIKTRFTENVCTSTEMVTYLYKPFGELF